MKTDMHKDTEVTINILRLTSFGVVVMVIGLNTFKESAITGTWKDGLLIKYPE